MTEPKENNDELIDLSSSEARSKRFSHVDEEPVQGDIFSPPPPKARIFHTIDRPSSVNKQGDLSGTDSFVDSDEEIPIGPAPRKSKLNFDRVEPDPLLTPDRNVYRQMAWTRHPLSVGIVIVILVLLYFSPFSYGIPRFPLWIIAIVITSYWLNPWNRYRNRYNMDWEADSDPTGCLFPRWYWW
jgi:hypothetical protein